MAVKIEMVSKPRAPRRLHQIVLNEVEKALEELGDEMVKRLEKDIESWDHQPEFISFAVANKKNWLLQVGYNRGTREADIYTWVDQGTGLHGPDGEEYDIFPVNADKLNFLTPTPTKSVGESALGGLGGFGIVLENALQGAQEEVFTDHVVHPGIEPRDFTGSLKKYYMESTRPGGFRSVIEAAVKRAYRKMGIYS